jgi:hypothetical protein
MLGKRKNGANADVPDTEGPPVQVFQRATAGELWEKTQPVSRVWLTETLAVGLFEPAPGWFKRLVVLVLLGWRWEVVK